MKFAILENEKYEAEPYLSRGYCPICNQQVIAKCGDINIWHWAHKSNKDCDTWAEHESEWHQNWKGLFPKELQEVTIKKGSNIHRADIRTKNQLIIELQNSPISCGEIVEREIFYENMIWLLNGLTLCKGMEFKRWLPKKDKNDNKVITFRWKHPNKSFFYSKKPIYIDFGEELLLIKKVYPKIPCGGYGMVYSKNQFMEAME